jgi:hypothetical protein
MIRLCFRKDGTWGDAFDAKGFTHDFLFLENNLMEDPMG